MSFEPEMFGEWRIERRHGEWVYLVRPGSDTEISAAASSDDLDIENYDASFRAYPPIAAIERLLELRREALANPRWLPEVGQECYFFTEDMGWLRVVRREDDIGMPSFQMVAWPRIRLVSWGDELLPLEALPSRNRESRTPKPPLSAPPSIAEDLKAPEPGSLEGAKVAGFSADCAPVVRDVLAELRGKLSALVISGPGGPTIGAAAAREAIERLAERFR